MNNKIDLYDDGIGFVELIDSVGSQKTIVNAARISFNTEKEELDEKDIKLIKYLIKHQHTSTLEHCFFTFKCRVPLFIARQHMRHRTFSYNEVSRRYTAEEIMFYEPKEFRTQHVSNRQASNENDLINPVVWKDESSEDVAASEAIKEHHLESVRLYNKLMENGVCREQARGVLPQNMYTSYIFSVNLNNLLKFLKLRTHEGAQKEIVDFAMAIRQIIQPLYPTVFEAFGV